MVKNRKFFSWRASDKSFDKAQLNQIEMTVSDVYVKGRQSKRKAGSSSWINLLKERVSSVKKRLSEFWKDHKQASVYPLDQDTCYFKATKTPRKTGRPSPKNLKLDQSICFQPRLPMWQKRAKVHRKANFVNVLEYYKAVLVDRATENMRKGRLACTLNIVNCTVRPKPQYSRIDLTSKEENIAPEPQEVEPEIQNNETLNTKRKRKDSIPQNKKKLDIENSAILTRQNKIFGETPDCSVILQNPDITQSANIIEKDDELAWLITQPSKKLITNEKIMVKKQAPKIKLVRATGSRKTKINPFQIQKLGREKAKPKLVEDNNFTEMKHKIKKAFEDNIRQNSEGSVASEQMVIDSKMETDADEFGTGYSNDVVQEGYNFFKKPFSHLRRLADQKAKNESPVISANLPEKVEEEEKEVELDLSVEEEDDKNIIRIVEEKSVQIQYPWQQTGNNFNEEERESMTKRVKFTPEFPDLFSDKFFGANEELRQKYNIFSENPGLFGLDENKWNNFKKASDYEIVSSLNNSLFTKSMNITNIIKEKPSLKSTTQGVFTSILNKFRGRSTSRKSDENRPEDDNIQMDKSSRKTKNHDFADSFNPNRFRNAKSSDRKDSKSPIKQENKASDLLSLRFKLAMESDWNSRFESDKTENPEVKNTEYEGEVKSPVLNKNLKRESKSIDSNRDNNGKPWSLLQMLRFK